MTSEQISQRSDLLGTQVITRDTGKRLGVVSQLWVDIDRREVVALSLRENLITGLLSGMPRYMYLSSIRQIGDVVLVDDDTVLEDVNVEAYSSLINSEVITETGEMLGRVRGFRFDTNTYTVTSLIIATIGLPQIPDQLISTYELPIEQIVSSGPDRLIVFEGAEEQMAQLTRGVLESLGIGKPPWEREMEDEYYMPPVKAENQLPSGTPLRTPQVTRSAPPVVEETPWDEDNWQTPQPEPMRQLRAEPEYREEYEEDNWSDVTPVREPYSGRAYAQPEPYNDYQEDYEEEYEDLERDAWADEEPDYQAPPVNFPQKTKKPEYEEETDY